MRISFAALSLLSAALGANSLAIDPQHVSRGLSARQGSSKMVFAHFVLGIVASYQQSDWENDMKIAQSIGIDAFALNIGTDSYTTEQLDFAYAAATATNFKVFISFDFSWFSLDDTAAVATLLSNYTQQPAQLQVNGAAFVSSFIGDNSTFAFPFHDAASQANVDIFACPNWQPPSFQNFGSQADCGFQWNAWPTQDNQPIDQNFTTAINGDSTYQGALGSKPYMAPVSPWMFTHYGPPPSYNKNWMFLSDTLYKTRWDEILELQPEFVEIITWNDFGESHYIGPTHDSDPSVYAAEAVQWATGYTHDGWRDVTAAYIAAYKAGQQSPSVTTDEIVYYYRPAPKAAPCNDPVPPPTGSDFAADEVFAIAMLTQPGTVIITSGSNAPVSMDVPAGMTQLSAPMGAGTQTFELQRNGASVMSGSGSLQIGSSCPQFNGVGVNNFNAFVGTVVSDGAAPPPPPASSSDSASSTDSSSPTAPPTSDPTTPTNTPTSAPSTPTPSQSSCASSRRRS